VADARVGPFRVFESIHALNSLRISSSKPGFQIILRTCNAYGDREGLASVIASPNLFLTTSWTACFPVQAFRLGEMVNFLDGAKS
jgi:hypothetical protein